MKNRITFEKANRTKGAAWRLSFAVLSFCLAASLCSLWSSLIFSAPSRSNPLSPEAHSCSAIRCLNLDLFDSISGSRIIFRDTPPDYAETDDSGFIDTTNWSHEKISEEFRRTRNGGHLIDQVLFLTRRIEMRLEGILNRFAFDLWKTFT